MRTLLPLALLAAMLAAAPPALAQESNETKNDEQQEQPADGGNAWVEDCPPDRMCAFGGGAEEPDPAGERPTYDGNCGAEVCAYGNESCIECSGPRDGGSTCMDGAQENETCRDDVQYLGGEPNRGPADGSCESCRGGSAGEAAPAEAEPIRAPADADAEASSAGADNEVPGLALAGTLGALAVVGLALRRRA